MANWWPFSWVGFGSRAFAETIDGSLDRANVRFLIPPDSRFYINRRTRKALNDHAEWAWQNFGVVKDGISGIARHTIAKGVSMQLDSEDIEWNTAAEADFENYALTPDRCDLSGRRNFYEAQTTAIEQRMVRGEFFAAKTENPQWGTRENPEPCFQLYDSEEIGSPVPLVVSTNPIFDGVELNKNSKAINYWIRDIFGEYSPLPASQLLHWYKPHAVNQTRGITELAQAVNPLVDIYELKKLATRSAKAQQLLALSLKGVKKSRKKGAFGGISQAGVTDSGDPDPNSAQIEKMVATAGGGIIYLDDTDGEAKLITAQSPSPLVEAFITDLLMRDACLSWGVPPEFFWNVAKMNGNTLRFILARADLFFQIMGDRLCDRFNTPIAFRYLSHRIKIGRLEACKDPNWAMKIGWQLPPRVTVDNGRENQILIELLANGLITMREYCNARGINYRATMRQWIREPIEFMKMAEAQGAPDEWLQRLKENLPLWRCPKPGAVFAPGADPAAVGSAQVADTDPTEMQQAA
jgi:capsid protein